MDVFWKTAIEIIEAEFEVTETETVNVEVETTVMALTLDGDEAEFLLDLMQKIGGDPTTTRRKYADRIRHVLYDAGIRRSDKEDTKGNLSSIYFY